MADFNLRNIGGAIGGLSQGIAQGANIAGQINQQRLQSQQLQQNQMYRDAALRMQGQQIALQAKQLQQAQRKEEYTRELNFLKTSFDYASSSTTPPEIAENIINGTLLPFAKKWHQQDLPPVSFTGEKTKVKISKEFAKKFQKLMQDENTDPNLLVRSGLKLTAEYAGQMGNSEEMRKALEAIIDTIPTKKDPTEGDKERAALKTQALNILDRALSGETEFVDPVSDTKFEISDKNDAVNYLLFRNLDINDKDLQARLNRFVNRPGLGARAAQAVSGAFKAGLGAVTNPLSNVLNRGGGPGEQAASTGTVTQSPAVGAVRPTFNTQEEATQYVQSLPQNTGPITVYIGPPGNRRAYKVVR